MKLLLEHDIDMMCRNQNGSNVLHIAVKKNNVDVIETLIDIQFPLNETKNNGVTAAGIAALKGNLKVLDMLYKAGADISKSVRIGVSPLYLAIKANKLDCV